MFDLLLKVMADPESEASRHFRRVHNSGGFEIVTPLVKCVSQAIDKREVAPADLGNSAAAEQFLERLLQQCGLMHTRTELTDFIARDDLARAGFSAGREADAYLELIYPLLLTKVAKHFCIEPFPEPDDRTALK